LPAGTYIQLLSYCSLLSDLVWKPDANLGCMTVGEASMALDNLAPTKAGDLGLGIAGDVLPCGGTGKLCPCGGVGKLHPCIGAREA